MSARSWSSTTSRCTSSCSPIDRANLIHAMLPVVLVAVLDPVKERVRGLAARADDFLTKPVSQAELLARVRSPLRIKALYDEVQAQRGSWRAGTARSITA